MCRCSKIWDRKSQFHCQYCYTVKYYSFMVKPVYCARQDQYKITVDLWSESTVLTIDWLHGCVLKRCDAADVLLMTQVELIHIYICQADMFPPIIPRPDLRIIEINVRLLHWICIQMGALISHLYKKIRAFDLFLLHVNNCCFFGVTGSLGGVKRSGDCTGSSK